MNNKTPFKDKSILITGGTGSFGRAMAKKLLQEDQCRKVIIFSRDEWKQWEMKESDPIYAHPKIRYFLGDIRDTKRLSRAFKDVQIIIHAAALKQVPAAEYNPSEFVKTNVGGAMNIIDVSIDSGVEKVIALSTDKAVNPVNLYGATKLCSDKLFIAGNSYVGIRGYPRFSVVRYGNVAGSRGSLIPFWKKMIEEGAKSIPITDERMTRFWITLENAVDFVKESVEHMEGGEIFVPKIPSVKIIDIAKALAPNLSRNIIGIRPGEKLQELLISEDEARHTVAFSSYFVIYSELIKDKAIEKMNKQLRKTGMVLPEDFSYGSHTNKEWLSIDDLKKWMKENNFF